MSITKFSGELPRIYSCSDDINNVNFVNIDFSSLNLISIPAINASTSTDVNVFLSDVTSTTAKINFSQKFVGKVYYTVIGFR